MTACPTSPLRRNSQNNETLPGNPWQGFVLTRAENLVVGRGVRAAARRRCGNASDTDSYDSNGAGRTRSRATTRRAGSCSSSLRHRATCQRHQKSNCQELFHETPLKGTEINGRENINTRSPAEATLTI